MKDYARRIEAVDRDVVKLKETTATKKQLADMKVDFRKLYVSCVIVGYWMLGCWEAIFFGIL